MNKKSESEIWRDFQQGDEEAYACIYQTYFFVLFNYGMKTIRDKEVVKDCIQNLFVHLWCNRQNLSPLNHIKPYLFKALRRDLIRVTRHDSKFKHQESWQQDHFEIVLSPEFTLIADQMEKEQKENLIRVLNGLTKRQREVVFLKFYDNLSYQEIASVMSISVDAVYNLMSQALGFLKTNVVSVTSLILIAGLFSFML